MQSPMAPPPPRPAPIEGAGEGKRGLLSLAPSPLVGEGGGGGSGPPTVEIVSFGCRLNAFESQVMRGHAAAAGLERAVVINTCAVTAEATRQARQAIRKARRENPEARIVVTGCAAQIDPAGFAAMPEVDHVLGNEEKLRRESFARLAEGRPRRIEVGDIMAATAPSAAAIEDMEGRARAFLQIQQGCDHRCTFCIIPYGRGNNRSLPLGGILAQARRMVEAGVKEIVLTGVDIGGYGGDLPGRPGLGQMVRRLLRQLPELARLRLSSIDPVEIDPDLWRLIAEEPRLMPHLHLSLQAGDDLILKRMKRRHTRAQAVAAARQAQDLRPGIALGADLIAGFPTETEAMFERSLALVEDCGLAFLHVFPYSARAGTPAARMPQLPMALRRERARRLRAQGAAAEARFLARQSGALERVLIERPGRGHGESFAEVETDAGLPGEILPVRITGRRGRRLIGQASTAPSRP
jgi:threonylcarbamoyladenosine tRNA methylthiotransferase MtaB